MIDLILILVIAGVVGAAVFYIQKQKKRGITCIGCPHAGACAHRQEHDGVCDGSCSEIGKVQGVSRL